MQSQLWHRTISKFLSSQNKPSADTRLSEMEERLT